MYAAFITGQLEAAHMDHKAHLQYPGVRQTLPQDEIRRGRREGDEWLASLREDRGLPPEYITGTGAAALTAQLLGDL